MLKTPDFKYPFQSNIHSFADQIQKHTIEWADQKKLFRNNKLKDQFDREKLGHLAARIHSNDSFIDCRLTSDYLLLFCMLDDESDRVQNSKEFKKRISSILSLIRGEPSIEVADETLNSWRDWWERVKKGTSFKWQISFIESLTECFRALVWETHYRMSRKIPLVEDYLYYRQYTGSVLVVFHFIERCKERKEHHPLLLKITSHANNIINLTNDIMSLRKELRLGDVHNLVICIREQKQISLEEAIDEVKRMHDYELKQYLKLEQELLKEKEVKQFIKGLQSSISGYYEWCLDTGRYE